MSTPDRHGIVNTFIRTMMWVAVFALVSGCGESETEQICELGQAQACPCLGGSQGAQECAEDR